MKLVVFRAEPHAWKWQCNRWSCHLTAQYSRWDLAHAAGLDHLRRHARFGFPPAPKASRPTGG